MKANSEKYHLLARKECRKKINIGNNIIGKSKCEKLSGINVYSKLNFGAHGGNLCKKAVCKIHSLARVTPYKSFSKKRILLTAFFKSDFSYCPLVWICQSRALNNKLNTPYEKYLRIICNDRHSTFHKLLQSYAKYL